MQRTHTLLAALFTLLALAAAAFFLLRGKNEKAPVQPRNPVQAVKTVRTEQKSLPITVETNGYVTALNTVEVRPQVQNIVRAIHVKEGQEVKAGQLLFTLDERTDQSNVARARAQVAAARAELAEAEMALKRNEDLLARNFVSRAVVDTARSKVDALRSNLRANEAAIQSSAIALGNNRIVASMNGRIGAISVHPGTLAQPSGDPMVTISQLDPIAVTFTLPERQLAEIAGTYPQGEAPVTAALPSGQQLNGRMFFIDNTADPQSGTIRMKAQFANTDRRLWPGTFVNVRLVARTVGNAVVLPAQAVVTGPGEKFVYLVQQDDTVRQQKVEVLAIENGQAAVSGVEPGARVVVEGTQNLRPGGKVREAQAGGQGGAAPGASAGTAKGA